MEYRFVCPSLSVLPCECPFIYLSVYPLCTQQYIKSTQLSEDIADHYVFLILLLCLPFGQVSSKKRITTTITHRRKRPTTRAWGDGDSKSFISPKWARTGPCRRGSPSCCKWSSYSKTGKAAARARMARSSEKSRAKPRYKPRPMGSRSSSSRSVDLQCVYNF